ncbi:Transcription factor TRY [Striga hermonthica]|uniref:Transcription factor TRY n=1 Tax=Striga hermonthica TaxID=68872 RepID=A0A9N7NIX5_STRHE|nr:Transcription factor TRY [Striga hermonthica]
MDKYCRQKHCRNRNPSISEEVSSIEWESIDMSEEEEDIINRMHNLVGDRWELIAGRIPGRRAEEIERFWLMRNRNSYEEDKRKVEHKSRQNSCA